LDSPRFADQIGQLTKVKAMKSCPRNHLSARARPFYLGDSVYVQMKCGPWQFLLDLDEAIELARELVAAVDRAKAADTSERHSQ
jgi:hypothetical protein